MQICFWRSRSEASSNLAIPTVLGAARLSVSESVADETGTDRTSVTVGAEGNGGAFAFAPPVVTLSTGTTVAWEWTGDAPHNVVFEDIDLSSGDPVPEAGVNFEHTFEETGIYRYACAPHRALGMVGAVIVE